MKSRLTISNAKMVFTQDYVLRSGKPLPLYNRLVEAEAPMAVVLPASRHGVNQQLRPGDLSLLQLKSLAPIPDLTLGSSAMDAGSGSSWWSPPAASPAAGATGSALPHIAEASAPTNILFSSGTTGEPKAIVWSHVTPLRCFADGWAHQDIKPGLYTRLKSRYSRKANPWMVNPYITLRVRLYRIQRLKKPERAYLVCFRHPFFRPT